jgi:hypothetical protein
MESSNQQSIAHIEAVAQPAAQVSEKKPREKLGIKHPARLGLIIFLLGWLFDFLFWKQAIGLNFALFSTLCLFGGAFFLFIEGYRPSRSSVWLLLPIAFFIITILLRQEPLTVFLAYTFTIFSIGLLASTYLGGRWFQYGLRDYLAKFTRLIAGIIYLPIDLYTEIHEENTKHGKQKGLPILAIVRGLAIALPIVVFFAVLLASADVIFKQKIGDFFGLFNFGQVAEYFFRLILISICAYILSGVFLYAAAQSKDEKLASENTTPPKSPLGFTESTIVLGSVFVLFMIFVVIQFQYFFGGETNIGITGYTYSQYARRGFNELVTVAFFSLVMILGLSTVTRRENSIQRQIYSGLSVGIVALVMVILVSAYQRISLAIDWHGFSRLRLYPRVFLLWLAMLLVTVVVLEILRQERYFAFAAVLASIGFAVSLTLVKVDAAIVKHNVPRVLQGKKLNVAHLASLSWDAVPILVNEYQSNRYSQSVHEGLGAVLTCYLHSDSLPGAYTDDWHSFNLSRWQAHKALQDVQISLQGYGINDRSWPVRVRTPSNVRYDCLYDSSTEER